MVYTANKIAALAAAKKAAANNSSNHGQAFVKSARNSSRNSISIANQAQQSQPLAAKTQLPAGVTTANEENDDSEGAAMANHQIIYFNTSEAVNKPRQ